MIFRDYTLQDCGIRSRREHDSLQLGREAVALCADLLRRLRGGELRLPHGVDGLPAFDVMLGLDAPFDVYTAPGRFFQVALPEQPPFQHNLVLPSTSCYTTDRRAIVTMLGVSAIGALDSRRLQEADTVATDILSSRPCLVTALLLGQMLCPEDAFAVSVAADFSTCFAAAMLEEEA